MTGGATVDVWRVAGDAAPSGALADLLDATERAHAERLAFREDRARFVLRRGVRRLLAARYLECRPAEVEFSTVCAVCGDPCHGKPAAMTRGRRNAGPCAVSVTSTRDEVIVAVGRETEVGVDAESVRDVRMQLYARVCSPAEREALDRLGDDAAVAQALLFLQLWTRKEAVLKLLGVGLARSAATIDALAAARDGFVRLSVPEPVWLRDLPHDGGAVAAVASSALPSRLRLFRARTTRQATLQPVEEATVTHAGTDDDA